MEIIIHVGDFRCTSFPVLAKPKCMGILNLSTCISVLLNDDRINSTQVFKA